MQDKRKAPEGQGRRNPKFKSKPKNKAFSGVTALGKEAAGKIFEKGTAAIVAAATKTKRGRHDSPHYHQRSPDYNERRVNNP